MILICGTKLKLSELPKNGLDYYIETDESQYVTILGAFLMTDDYCDYAFVSNNFKALVSEDVAVPIEFFKDDTELLEKIKGTTYQKEIGEEKDKGDTSDFMMIADLQSEVDAQAVQIGKLEREISELKDTITEKEGLIEQLQADLEEKEGIIKEQGNMLDSDDKTKAETSEQIEELNSKIVELQDELDRVNNLLKVKEVALASYENNDDSALQEIQQKYTELQESLAESNKALSEMQNKCVELQKQLEESKTAENELQEKYNDLEKKAEEDSVNNENIKELQTKYDDLQAKYDTECTELKTKVEELSAEKEKLETEKTPAHKAVELQLEQLQQEFDDFKNAENPELTKLKEEYNQLQQEYETYKTTESPEMTELKSEYEQLKQDFEEYKNTDSPELIELRNIKASMEAEKQELENKVTKLTEDIAKSAQENQEAQTLILELQNQVNEKKIELQKQRSDFDVEKAGLGVEIAKLDSLNTMVTSLNNEIQEKQKTINQLNLNIAEISTQLASKDIEIARVQAECKSAKDDLQLAESLKQAALSKQKLEMEAEAIATKTDLENTRKRLEELKKAYSQETVGNSSSGGYIGTVKGSKDYDTYTLKPKTALDISFSSREKGYLNFSNPVVVVTSCGDGSVTLMRDAVKHWVDTGYEMCLLDFTGDMYLTYTYKLMAEVSGTTTGDMLKQNVNIGKNIFKTVKKTLFVPCVPFNDVAIMEQNWGKLLNEVSMVIPEGMPIVILLNGFESFVTRYVVQKLSDKYNTMIFMEGQPSILYSTTAFLQMVATKSIGMVVGNVKNAMASKLQKAFGAYKLSKYFPDGVVPDRQVLESFYR